MPNPNRKAGFAHVVLVLTILVLAAVAFLVYKYMTKPQALNTTAGGAPASLGAQVYDQAKNPVNSALPQTNPFAKKINPFQE